MSATDLRAQLAEQQTRRKQLASELPLAQQALAGFERNLTDALARLELGEITGEEIRAARHEHTAADDRVRSIAAAILMLDARISDTQEQIAANRSAELAVVAEYARDRLDAARVGVRLRAEMFAQALTEFAKLQAAALDGNFLTGVSLQRAAGNPIEVMKEHGVTVTGDLVVDCTRRARLSEEERLVLLPLESESEAAE